VDGKDTAAYNIDQMGCERPVMPSHSQDRKLTVGTWHIELHDPSSYNSYGTA